MAKTVISKIAKRNKPPVKQPMFTVEQMLEGFKGSYGILSIVANKVGCNPATVRHYIEIHPEVKQARFEEKEKMKDFGERALIKAIEKEEGWAIKWLLATQAKDRGYTEKTEVEHSGSIEANIFQVGYGTSQKD